MVRAVAYVSALLVALLGQHAFAGATTPSAARQFLAVSGSGTVSAVVDVPTAATVQSPFRASPDFSVQGGGAISVLTLRHRRSADVITAVQIRTLSGVDSYVIPTGGINSPTPTGHYELYKTYSDEVTIRPGTWDLTMVTDGPATAKLRLRGLRAGTTTLKGKPRRAALVAHPAPDATSPEDGYSGNDRPPSRTGLYVQVLVFDTSVWVAGQTTLCRRIVDPSTEPALTHPTACINGQRTTFNERIRTTEPDAKVLVSVTKDLPVDALFGITSTGEGLIDKVTYTTLAL